jgi:hypothetical protein
MVHVGLQNVVIALKFELWISVFLGFLLGELNEGGRYLLGNL